MRPELSSEASRIWVSVVNRQNVLDLPSDEIVSLATFVLRAENREAGLEVALVDDDAITELHERFLGIAEATDVLAFPGDSGGDPQLPESSPPAALGEVVVSTETARRQAPEFLGDPRLEALLYLVHGILHLVGYDDQTDEESTRMSGRQLELLREWQHGEGE